MKLDSDLVEINNIEKGKYLFVGIRYVSIIHDKRDIFGHGPSDLIVFEYKKSKYPKKQTGYLLLLYSKTELY